MGPVAQMVRAAATLTRARGFKSHQVPPIAVVVELVDTLDLKSSEGETS